MAFNKAKAMQEAEKLFRQGKIAQAIKQYNFILEKDPTDVSLLNNIGDLYFRDKNVPEALKHFHKLADAYVRDGFTVKAIAMYRKISKIDPDAVEPFSKLAELYILQGLGREAREQYAQAVELYRRKNQPDQALDTFRKIVALDPENKTFRRRLAEFAEQVGRKDEAASAYLELAEVAFRGGDLAGGETALKKALELGGKSSQTCLLEARLALSKQEYGQVETILESTPDVKTSAAGRQILLEAYLAAQKLELAEKLVVDVFRANPADFSPVASFSTLCTKKGNVDSVVKLLGEVADALIDRKETGPMMEILRQVWAKNPDHLATLELIHRISKETADEFALPEVLGALGRAYEQSGALEKAEGVYRELVGRTPGNEEYERLLKGVLEKQGKKVEVPSPAALEGVAMEIPPEVEAAPAPPAAEAEQAEMVKEALENSDLFSRYGLVDKAVAELEKVLAVYPEQADIHRRILEICHRSQTVRAGQAAEALARVYTTEGDLASAKKYQELATQLATGVPSAEVPPVAEEAPPPPPPPAPAPASMEFDLAEVFPVSAPEEAPPEVPLDVSAPVSAPPPVAPTEGLELSADMEALLAEPETPVVEKEVAPFNYDEARVEIDFYLDQGLLDEARSAVQALEEESPGNSYVAELRQRVEAQAGAPAVAPAEVAAPPAAEPAEAAAAEGELPSAFAGPPPAEVVPEVPPAPVEAVVPPPVVEPPPPPPEAAVVAAGPPSAEAPAAGGDFLGSLVGDLAAGLEGFGEPTPPPSAPPTAQAQPAPGGEAASLFSGLLEELGEGAAGAEAEEDPEKHYNLGVAFREMGLLDEAIGEFQKVVKGTQKDKFPPNFLQACSLLAVCFTDKGMPAIAVKWYKRALELPDLDEESTLALEYDLGVAYEQAGDTRNALERFSEVYSQNIDYRDVAEKIRTLQKKAP